MHTLTNVPRQTWSTLASVSPVPPSGGASPGGWFPSDPLSGDPGPVKPQPLTSSARAHARMWESVQRPEAFMPGRSPRRGPNHGRERLARVTARFGPRHSSRQAAERVERERGDLAGRLERLERLLDVRGRVQRRHHEADARLALGDDRVAQAVAVDAVVVEVVDRLAQDLVGADLDDQERVLA